MEKNFPFSLDWNEARDEDLGVPRFSVLQWSLEAAFSIELDEQIVEFALPDHVFLIEFNVWTINNSGVGDRI